MNAERRPRYGGCQTKDLPITNIVLDRKYTLDKELSIFKVVSNFRWASVYALSRVPEVGDLGTAMLVHKCAGSSPIVIFQDLEDNDDTDTDKT